MQVVSFRRVIVFVLLVIGLGVVYTPRLLTRKNFQPELTYIADLDYWQRTDREQAVEAALPIDMQHGLDAVPLQLGNWRGEDVPETNLEVFILLEPEQFVQRRYQDDAGHIVWLTLIGSRKTRSFHPPDLCYAADGWQTSLASRAIPLDGGGNVYGLWLTALKQSDPAAAPAEHRVFYFYLFPNRARNQTDGLILVRITSPPYGTDEETLTVQGDFLRQLLRRAAPASVL